MASKPATKQENKQPPPPWISAVAGLSGGVVVATLFCPFDVLRTRLAINKAQNVSPTAMAKTIYKTEGIRTFYTGLSATLMALGPNWAVYFTSYNGVKSALGKYMNEGPAMHLIAAATGAAITDFITNPLWMIKTRFQTQRLRGRPQFSSVFDAGRTIVREEGVRALWAGVTPQLVGIIHVAVQFPLYEFLKKQLQGDKDHLSSYDTLVASSASKTIASIVAYPHEVLRARFQFQQKTDAVRYHNILDATKRIYAEEGIRALYKGMGTNLFRVVPSCAVTFMVYEYVVQKLHH